MTHVTKLGNDGLELIKNFEGFRSRPYLDIAGIPTIGYGNTYYPNGARVTMQDPVISEEWGEVTLMNILKFYEQEVDNSTTDLLKQCQFDALVCFMYNIGAQNFKKSTLLRLINLNPNDPNISLQFIRWNKVKGKTINGLTKRRLAESQLYFKC